MTEEQLIESFNRIIEERCKLAPIPLPTKAPHYDIEDAGVPQEMESGEINADGWVNWKWLPSRVTSADVRALEDEFGPFSLAIRAYLRAHCHLLQEAKWKSDHVRLFPIPSDAPLGPFREQLLAWLPLVRSGYVPFASMGDGYGPICIDTNVAGDSLDFPVIWFEHEELVPLDPPYPRSALAKLVRPLGSSSEEFLVHTLNAAM